MKYFLFADIYRAKTKESDLRKYFTMAIEDAGLDIVALQKYNGSGNFKNPNSIQVKRDGFNSPDGRGYLYQFDTNTDVPLTDSQLLLIKNSLVMNIMGVVDVMSFDVLESFEFVVKTNKEFIKQYSYILQNMDKQYPLLKFYDIKNPPSTNDIIKDFKKKSFKVSSYAFSSNIKLYFQVRSAQLELQKLLCE